MHCWLPDHQLGVAATLSHADELIGQVADLLFDYQNQPGGTFDLTEVPEGTFSKTVVERVAPIPRKVPLLVTNALVTLRAALEHALFAEVEFLDGSPLDEKAARLVEMPASEVSIQGVGARMGCPVRAARSASAVSWPPARTVAI